MKKLLLQELKSKLNKEKLSLEQELHAFAEKDKNLKGDWDTRYPKFNSKSADEEADEFEEYATLLPIEHSLEIKLRDINLALEKIEKEQYGKCEKCGQAISLERLKILPEARTCNKCK